MFLYQLESGQAKGSYGLNVAALAGLPNTILELAQAKSKQLQYAVIRNTLISETDISSFQDLISHNLIVKCFQWGKVHAQSVFL